MAQELTAQDARVPELACRPDSRQMRWLGLAPLQGLAGLLAALSAVAGPPLAVYAGPGIAALLQPEPPGKPSQRGRAALLASLQTVQRRLEIACQAGPFLPVDPAAACCAEAAVPGVLDPAWDRLGAALARHGRHHQWDIVLRWPPQTVLAQRRDEIARAASGKGREGLADAVATALRAERDRREAALVAALEPAVLEFAPAGAAGTDGELVLTVLVPAGGEAAIEAALEGLAPEHVEGASIDLRGPLPPVSFAAVRVADIDAAAIGRAWALLELPSRIDAAGLHRHWRRRAFTLHPDRHGAAPGFAAALSEAADAYHVLRDLLRDSAAGGGTPALADLMGRAGHRLVVPALPDPLDEPALAPVAVAASPSALPALQAAL